MELIKLRALLTENADKNQAEKMAAYMRNQFGYFGIPTGRRRELSKQFFTDDKLTDLIDWNFIFECFDADERELQYIALEYVTRHNKELTIKDIPNLKKLVETKSWWDTIDCLDRIIGNIALKDKNVNKTLLEWSTDKNFWLRRIAIDHQLGRKDKTDTELLATIIKNNFGQTEFFMFEEPTKRKECTFFINKAIGWSLREYSKINPDWVRNFVTQNKEKMAKLSIKEANKYI